MKKKGGMELKTDENEDDEDSKYSAFEFDFDGNNRWETPAFVCLLPLLRGCLSDILDPKSLKKGKYVVKQHINKRMVEWALGLVICHCHDCVNINDPFIKFPSQSVARLLLQCIVYFGNSLNLMQACEYGLCQLVPAMNYEFESSISGIGGKSKGKKGKKGAAFDNNELSHLLSRDGALNGNKDVRRVCLNAISLNRCMMYPQNIEIISKLWILCYDCENAIKKKANAMWKQFEFESNLESNGLCCLFIVLFCFLLQTSVCWDFEE